MRVVLHSSKAVDKAATKVAVWARGTAPDPGVGAGSELHRRQAGGQLELLGVGEGLPGECFAAEAAPPAFLQIAPARAGRDGDRMRPWMGHQPVLDRPTGVAGELVADHVELPRRIGLVERLQQLQVAGGSARGSGEGEFLPVVHPQGAIHPDLLGAAVVVEWGFAPVAAARPAGGRWEGARRHRPERLEAAGRRAWGRVGGAGDDRGPCRAKSFASLAGRWPQECGRRPRTLSFRSMRRTWLRPIGMPCAWAAAARASSDHSAVSPPSGGAGARLPSACVTSRPGGGVVTRAITALRWASVSRALRPPPPSIPT